MTFSDQGPAVQKAITLIKDYQKHFGQLSNNAVEKS